jgi:hypothetical protein
MESEENKARLILLNAEAGKGGVIFLGEPRGLKIREIVDYKLRTAKWRNIVCGSRAVEIDASDMVKIWRKIKEDDLGEEVVSGDKEIVFRGETLFREENAIPKVTVDGEPKEERISYSVFTGQSGAAVCLEEWPGKILEAYFLEKEIDILDIDIIYH